MLAIGALTLTPTFSESHVLYQAATTNATDAITATTTVSGATVAILNGSTSVTSGSSATWVTGVNHVKITVTKSGEDPGIYHVDVTKS